MLTLSSLLQTSHAVIRRHCGEGDVVLDATVGNGKDTVFLAQLVGEGGLVIAVDKQKDALAKAAKLLEVMDLTARVKLVQAEHSEVGNALNNALPQKANSTGLMVAVFNLGYLPGGNKLLTTDVHSTLIALDAVWPMIRPGGLLSVHTYTGHAGAEGEARAVESWARNLAWREAQVTACTQLNKAEHPETLYLVVKASS